MSTLKTNRIENLTTTDGGISIDNSGNVGINTSSPNVKLEVGGSVAFRTDADVRLTLGSAGSIGSNDSNYIRAATDQIIYNSATSSGRHSFELAGSEKMRLDSNGRLGVGTISPDRKLHVAGDWIRVDDGYGLDTSGGTEKVKLDNGYIALTTASLERMRINSSGQATFTGSIRGDGGTTSTPALLLTADNNSGKGLEIRNAGNSLNVEVGVDGNATFAGSVSKGSGSFRIDHPLKPETHQLVHSFVEGPQADNIYRGKVDLVDGTASVNIDVVAGMTEGTFVALNREIQCFTTNETGWTAIRGSVSNNILTIEAQDSTCTDTISWLVIGERQDQHMYDTEWTDENGKVIVEPEKIEVAPLESN